MAGPVRARVSAFSADAVTSATCVRPPGLLNIPRPGMAKVTSDLECKPANVSDSSRRPTPCKGATHARHRDVD